MADEIRLNATLQYEDTDLAEINLQMSDLLADVATLKYVEVKQSVGTSEEALVLGEITSPGWLFAINRDTTNYIELRVATGGAKFAKLLPGEFCLLRLGSGATAPFAIANTAACMLQYALIST